MTSAGLKSFPTLLKPDFSDGNALFSDALLRRFGITRVGDVTGLDTIGIPVWFASRPNSRSLSVSQGKGLTSLQARISAVMEAIEGAVAETPKDIVSEFGTLEELERRGSLTVPFGHLARTDPSLINRQRQRAWVKGISMQTGECVLAPYELIGMDMRADFPWDRSAFHMSSQGLAAGLDFDSAALHALLEIVEHDASFTADSFDHMAVARRKLLYRQGIDSTLDEIMGHLSQAEIEPLFYDLTNSLEVPVVMAVIPRMLQSASGPIMRYSSGIASRLKHADAASAALLEAVQSRLTDIAGARDDLPSRRYEQAAKSVANTSDGGIEITATSVDLPRREASTPQWKRLAEHLLARGAEDVFVYSLPTGIEGIFVVRILVSGLAASAGAIDRFSTSALSGLLQPRSLA